MRRRRLRPVEGTSEEEARRSAEAVTASATAAPYDSDRDHPALDARLHRDPAAAELTAALGAEAVAVGRDVYLGANAPGPGTDAGRRLLAHELTHVVQQQRFGARIQRFTAAHRPLIAKDLAAMMAVVDALVTASSRSSGDVIMDDLVRHAGGKTAVAGLPKAIRSDDPKTTNLLTLRYLFTARAGLVDMWHFFQLLYISWFTNMGNAAMAARGATKRGVEHERTAPDIGSRFGPEDLTSNALGAWTGTLLAGFPQRDDLVARVRETLQRCAPVNFDALSPASQASVVQFYAAKAGTGKPLNQNPIALALVPHVPELAGTDRSFPFTLDDDDPRRATIGGRAFGSGAALHDDDDTRDFVALQRDEVIRDIPAAERARLGALLLSGWVSDDDLTAYERLYRLAEPVGRAAMRAAVAGEMWLSSGQLARLRVLITTP